MAFGFAIARFGLFLSQIAAAGGVAHAPRGVGSGWLGIALVALGMVANLVATLRFGRVRGSIERGDVGAPGATLPYAIGAVASVVGLVMALLLARSLGD